MNTTKLAGTARHVVSIYDNLHSRPYNCILQVPQEVLLPEPVAQVATGHYHTLFLTQSGDVWTCGRNSRGQLGLGSKAGSHACTPQPLNALAGLDLHQLSAIVCILSIGSVIVVPTAFSERPCNTAM